METADILAIVTAIVTVIMGIVSKKSKHISNYAIPIQNLAIGLVVAVVEFVITKDFKVSIALSGLTAGGTYDIINNLIKLQKAKEEQEKELSNGKGEQI